MKCIQENKSNLSAQGKQDHDVAYLKAILLKLAKHPIYTLLEEKPLNDDVSFEDQSLVRSRVCLSIRCSHTSCLAIHKGPSRQGISKLCSTLHGQQSECGDLLSQPHHKVT